MHRHMHTHIHAQILRLCSSMRHVHLTMDTDEGVREAVSWLRRAHPLSHTTTQRKSQVHHALAEMLSNVGGDLCVCACACSPYARMCLCVQSVGVSLCKFMSA